MNTCSSCACRPTGAGLQRRYPRGRLRRTSPAEGTPGLARAGALTCYRGNGLGEGRNGLDGSSLQSRKGCQRARPARREGGRKSCCACIAGAKAQGDSLSTRSRQRAVKHGAAGGWMTARWSGVFREQRRQRPVQGGSRWRTPAGFPTALGGKSPEKVVLLRVLVTRNVGCRSGFKASRRCAPRKAARPIGCFAAAQSSSRPRKPGEAYESASCKVD
jgi:hypothetical protein